MGHAKTNTTDMLIIFKNQFVPKQPDALDCNCYSQTT